MKMTMMCINVKRGRLVILKNRVQYSWWQWMAAAAAAAAAVASAHLSRWIPACRWLQRRSECWWSQRWNVAIFQIRNLKTMDVKPVKSFAWNSDRDHRCQARHRTASYGIARHCTVLVPVCLLPNPGHKKSPLNYYYGKIATTSSYIHSKCFDVHNTQENIDADYSVEEGGQRSKLV